LAAGFFRKSRAAPSSVQERRDFRPVFRRKSRFASFPPIFSSRRKKSSKKRRVSVPSFCRDYYANNLKSFSAVGAARIQSCVFQPGT
jgi:hypothetical protein